MLTAVLAVLLCDVGTAGAQIINFEKVGDKTITCMHTGLWSLLADCGARSYSYAYVFVGSISSVTPVANDEKEIQILPQEIFHGRPASPLKVLTSQALCLPKMAVGDRWLFFLRLENGKPIVLDYYGNDSRPIADAQQQIETLRRLANIGDRGIVRGRVWRGESSERKALPHAHVVARGTFDGTEFDTTTGVDGRFEFEPLAPGRYTLTVDPVGSYQPDSADLNVSRGGCWDLTLSKSPKASLGGSVRRADGSPVSKLGVLLTSKDRSWYCTRTTNASGHFRFDELRAGEYIVGINLPGAPAWQEGGGAGVGVAIPKAPLYYPGVQNQPRAGVISLAEDQQRDDINFLIPK